MEKSFQSGAVKVNIPIACSVNIDKPYKITSNHCRLESMSLETMSISFPFIPELIEETIVDFDLDLPEPFMRIRGQGHIQWKQWDDRKKQTNCNLLLEPLTLKQLVDYDILLNELSKTSHQHSQEVHHV